MENNIKKELSTLISINKDATEFYYESAKELAENPQLKATFQNLGDLHNSIAINLKNHLEANGVSDAEIDETMTGELAKFWGKLKAQISNDTDETLVTQLEEAEDRCLHKIQDIMDNDDISAQEKSLLQREYTSLRKSHDYMKDLKDSMKAA